MRTRGVARVVLCSFVSVAVLATGCSGAGGSLSYKPPFAPITLSVNVDASGHVSVKASVSSPKLVTPIGEFAVSGGISQSIIDTTPGFVVSFRSGARDSVYRIDSDDLLHLQVDGHLVEDVTEHSARITVSPGSAYQLTISDPPPPTPDPRIDPGCRGDEHHKRLPYISAGIDGTQTLQQIIDALHSICLNVTIVPEKQEDCVRDMVGISWEVCDLNTIDSVSIPFQRTHFIWWNWSYHYLTYQRQTTASYPCGGVYPSCGQTTWGWDKDPSGRPTNTGDAVTVYSDHTAVIKIASIPVTPMQYADGSWHPWPPDSPQSRKAFVPKTNP